VSLRRALVLASLLTCGCSDLPPIPLQLCGNHIVEPDHDEDCDSDSLFCVPPGQPNECHVRCYAYPNSICPVGSICSGTACRVQSGVCGNHVRDPGELCDGEVGCIPASAPAGACHFRCSSYPNSICPPRQICDEHGACVPADHLCGNHYVDPGEECDGQPDCLPPGSSDGCKWLCAAHPEGHCPTGSICNANNACVPATGVCGNLILDQGEDCDGTVGCGQPGTPAACRFSCAGDASCDTGMSCGHDQICRRPTGFFNVSDPIGSGDEQFQVTDVDGDGTPDLIGRGPDETTLFHNDGTGALSVTGRGWTPSLPNPNPGNNASNVLPYLSPFVALTADKSEQIAVALTNDAAGLFRVYKATGDTTSTLQPLVTPTYWLPNNLNETFVAMFDQNTSVFRIDATTGTTLVVYRTQTGQPAARTELDVNKLCGGTSSSVDVFASLNGSQIELLLVLDHRYLCLAEGAASAQEKGDFNASKLDTLGTFEQSVTVVQDDSSFRIGAPVALDVNGDGLLDVACTYTFSETNFQGQGIEYFVRSADGTFPLGAIAGIPTVPILSSADKLSTVDLNRDGRGDLLLAGIVYLSTPNYGFLETGTYFYPPVQQTTQMSVVTGDVNGDGLIDIVQSFSDRLGVAVCVQKFSKTGYPRFFCHYPDSSLAGVSGVGLQDVDGDGRDDILAFGIGTPAWGNVPMMSARYSGDPPGSPVDLLVGYHGSIAAVNPVAMQMDDGRSAYAAAIKSAPRLAFGIHGISHDLRTADFDGDGNTDLLLLGQPNLFTSPELDTSVPIADIGIGFRFLDYPGQTWPVIFNGGPWAIPSIWIAGSKHQYDTSFATELYGPAFAGRTQQVKGDGTSDIVLYDRDCDVYFIRNLSTLAAFADSPTGYRCDDLFFIDVAPQDGIPDAIFGVRKGTELTSHLLLARARADGTYNGATPVEDPPLAHVPGKTPTAMPAGSKYVGAADFNGDGIDDIVFWTSDGAVIAFAEVDHK
jgi:hypothetical protein